MPHIIKTVIHLVRHGEPEGGERFRGRLDHPLNETGWAQMRAALDAFSGCDVVVSSPLKRCIEPAMEQAQRFAVPLWVDSRLREMSFGAWEGMTSDQIQARYGVNPAAFWKNPVANPPPNSEDMESFCERVDSAWENLCEVRSGQRILLVAHGAVIRIILKKIVEFPLENMFHLRVPHAAVARVEIDETGTVRIAGISHTRAR